VVPAVTANPATLPRVDTNREVPVVTSRVVPVDTVNSSSLTADNSSAARFL
jgi:hypothetical protein